MPSKDQNQPSQSSQAKPLSDYEVVRNAGFRDERHMALSYGLKQWPIDDDELEEFKLIRDGLRDQMEIERAEQGE
jgi:hypothetical protein